MNTSNWITFSIAEHGKDQARFLARCLQSYYRRKGYKALITNATSEYVVCWRLK